MTRDNAQAKRLAGAQTAPAVVHVGYRRTATTTHQNQIFNKHKDINYLGKPYPSDAIRYRLRYMVYGDSVFFDPQATRDELEKALQTKPQGRVLTISDEAMTWEGRVDTRILCRRLIELFGDPKVVIVVRRQDELLFSWLSLNIKKEYSLPLKLRLQRLENNTRTATSLLDYLDFAPICRVFVEMLGSKNVLVVPFELFRSDCRRYSETLSDFMNIDRDETFRLLRESRVMNSRESSDKIAYYDLKRRLLPKLNMPMVDETVGRLISLAGINARHVDDIETKVRALCTERYEQSNRALSENFDLDLQSFGYPGLGNRT